MKKENEIFMQAGDIPAMLMRLPKGMYKLEITPVECAPEVEPCLPSQEPRYYIELLSKQLGLAPWDTVATCKRLNDAAPGSLMSLLLMTIAKELDMNYPDHISNCSEVYVYNTVNSKIGVIPTKNISKAAFRYFAAFRIKEEAIFAIKLANVIKTFINEH